ncbi:MAG: PAS domain S-box protein [Candidatus Omnitrophica bacterium]|nr:PAS domain S-box protein [Candidatus Omnitrophota bacterium]
MNFLWPLLLLLVIAGAAFLLRRERRLRNGFERQISELNQKFKRATERLDEERARLETTFSGMVEGVLLTDARGDILHVNPPFREMFGLKGKAEGRSALEVLTSVAADDAIRQVIQNGEPVEREIHFEKPRPRVFQVHFSPVRRDGKLSGVVSVFHDLTEIRRLEEVRRDFIANLSHELKTPLTAIRGYSETLLEVSDLSSEEFRRHLETIFRNAVELSHLTENLLNLSRIESGREEVLLELIPLRPFVDRLLERFQSQAEAKRIEIENEVPQEAVPLQADSTKLNQILANLVDNALKYTSEGGRIWVRSEVSGKEFRISVEDNGAGIPKADQERIFEKFYRVDKARSRDSGGAGLGLAIVKHLTELHGGRVRVFSGPGHGSRFQISLPQP